MRRRTKTKIISAIIVLGLSAAGWIANETGIFDSLISTTETEVTTTATSIDEIPEYDGSLYVEINDNVPFFTDDDIERLSVAGYEYYTELDDLGRATLAEACVGTETMPTEERGSIGMIKPSGWHTVKYDFVDGKYLYNRCHLLGYQLTGENANECNLITGTRQFNVEGMLPFENEVADYMEETGNRVAMRVTAIYDGDNLVATGVLMEARSIEDETLEFNVFVYNVQDGVRIDYATGESYAE